MARYTPAPEPFLTPEMTGGAMRAVVGGIAARISTAARTLAPIDRGDYIQSIDYEVVTGDWFAHGPRAVGIVSAGTFDHSVNEATTFVEAIFVEAKYGVMMKAMGAA